MGWMVLHGRIKWGRLRDHHLVETGRMSRCYSGKYGRTDVEAEAPILWPPDLKSWLFGKDPDDGKGWRQEEKGDERGWDGWMVSPIQWTWVQANSWRKWRMEEPGRLAMGSQSWTGLSDWPTAIAEEWYGTEQLSRIFLVMGVSVGNVKK